MSSENERYTAPVQALLTPTQRDELRSEARRRGVTTSNLVRIVIGEWLEANCRG